MPGQNLGKMITVPAGADLSASQYCFVKLDNQGRAVLPTDGGDAIGILQNNPNAAGQAATVMVGEGISKVVAAGAATAADYVSTDGSGNATSNDTGDVRLGQFLDSPTAQGQIVSILFQKKGATA